MSNHQKTLAKTIELTGVGLHSGEQVTLRLRPAAPGHGIVFRRVDLTPCVEIEARVENVVETTLATVLGKGKVTISTVEHCLSALYGMGVDNAVVEVNGPELPILDGSAKLYAERIAEAGLRHQSAPRSYLRIEKPIRVEEGDKFSILMPSDSFSVTYSIQFDGGFPGEQHYFLQVTPASFGKQLASARTFGFLRDIEMLQKIGKARGASLENAVGLHEGKVLNPEGLRMPDELVRHKMLDAVGDLSLAGYPIQGHLIVHKGGHELHRKLVAALLARPDAWSLVHPTGVRVYPVYGGAQVAAAVAAHA